MAMTDFTIVRRSLLARLFSTVTTTLTVAVAVALMLVLLSMRESSRRAFDRGSGNMHLLVSAESSPLVSVLNGVFYANAPARPITLSRFQQIAADPRLAFAIPTQQGDSYQGFPVLASVPDFFTKFSPDPNFDPQLPAGQQTGRPWSFAEGRAFDKSFEVVLGSRVQRATGLKLGDTIHLTHGIQSSRQLGPGNEDEAPHIHKDFTFTVVGILAPTGSAHDRAVFTDLDSAWILHAHDKRQDADPSITTTTLADVTDDDRKITGIYLRGVTRPGSTASPVIPQIGAELRRDPSIMVAEPSKQIAALFRIVSNIDQVLLGMAAVVMLSSGIAIMLALYNSMEQRRRQIAVLRVLGCSRPRIVGLILTESAMLGLIGALAGTAAAAVGGLLIASIMKRELGVVVEPSLALGRVLVIGAGTIALASLAGVIPGVLAYRTSVAQNLRPMG